MMIRRSAQLPAALGPVRSLLQLREIDDGVREWHVPLPGDWIEIGPRGEGRLACERRHEIIEIGLTCQAVTIEDERVAVGLSRIRPVHDVEVQVGDLRATAVANEPYLVTGLDFIADL